jgi:formylglycine-generating enzyme required for sulfatase activity
MGLRHTFIRGLGFGLAMLMASDGIGHAAAAPKAGSTFKDCANCPEMVMVPAGKFMMGSDVKSEMKDGSRGEGPIREITIKNAFALAKNEVTVAEFAAFVDATGYQPSTFCNTSNGTDIPLTFRGPINGKTPDPKQPVTCVSWVDSIAYAAWMSGKTGKKYRLPTEAEWEYAARGGTQSEYITGAMPVGIDNYAWFSLNSGKQTQPVGGKQANGFGLHDVFGNVYEWMQDCYIDHHNGAPTDGSAVPDTAGCPHVVKGGSYFSGPGNLRPSDRGRFRPDRGDVTLGFRVARTVP